MGTLITASQRSIEWEYVCHMVIFTSKVSICFIMFALDMPNLDDGQDIQNHELKFGNKDSP